MIIETGFVALLVAAVRKSLKGRGGLSAEDETIYLEALSNLSGPEAPAKFRKMADWLSKHGHFLESKMLRARADYLDASPEEWAERKAIIARAMRSTNASAVRKVANWFESRTATGIARDLRAHALEVEEGRYTPPNEKPKTNGHVQAKHETVQTSSPNPHSS